MRRRIAIVLVFLMMFNVLAAGLGELYAYGQEPIPVIPQVIRVDFKEIVEVNAQGNKVTQSVVVFNGMDLSRVQEIVVYEKIGDQLHARKALAPFNVIRSNEIHYRPESVGQTPKDIFGLQGTSDTLEVQFRIRTQEGLYPEGDTIFHIPLESQIMRVDTINGLSHHNWPITVIQEEEGTFTLEGSNFRPNDYELSVSQGDFANVTPYSLIDSNNRNRVSVEIGNAPHGANQNLIFKRDTGPNVALYYTVREAINIVRPLDLGDNVTITPLQGTRGAIMRIMADNHHFFNDAALKVFIGGMEAPRNVSPFNKNGIFEYADGEKIGIEVIVPNLGTVPLDNLPIEITLEGGDTYSHDKRFKYFPVSETRLQVVDVNPEEGFTNTNNIIELLRLRNAVEVKNIPDEYQLQFKKSEEEGKEHEYKIEIGKYNDFQPSLEAFGEDARAIFIRYELANNQFIERKINIDIGLPVNITRITNSQDIKAEFFNSGNPYFENFRATTQQVHDIGPQPIYVRTETVLFDGGQSANPLYNIVEEAPYPGDSPVPYTYKPDQNAPQIQNITPDKGPHDQEISATITGTNFRVESIGQNKFYPTIIIGSDVLGYKVIKKEGAYLSEYGDGTNLGESVGAFDFVVLDNNGNIVDGEARKIGTQIKFTIPAKMLENFEGIWNATVTVYNPNPTGGLGGRNTWTNHFQYIFPDSSVLIPQINSVEPDRVAVGSNAAVTVRGRYFQNETMVTIDGEVIPNPQIDVARGIITFNAPDGRPGKTKLQVINPDGGFASHDFEYIRTFSQPYIESIIPNFGGKGSLVIIKGNNFYPPDSEGQNDDYKIGTRVYIDGRDINYESLTDYQTLTLRDFKNPYDEAADAPLILGPDGEPLETYGSHVAVVDHETIYLIVPDPEGQKNYPTNRMLQLRVVNPDLGSYTVQNGFRIINVARNPEIEEISPNLGDYRGGNIVEISGDYFLENVRVYFGTQEAQVYRRRNNGTALWVYVPPYGGQLKEKNRATVPVTVQNSNGSSVTKYDGYNYVNPGYDAKITNISPNTGNTAGGDRILISGENFRSVTGAVYEGGMQKPAVYFGGIKVDPQDVTFNLPPKETYAPIETTDLIIVENTPPNPPGRVDVTVINYDGAIATLRNGFEYRTKVPAITQVLPNQGTVYGGDEITIIGRDFVERGLYVTFGEEEGRRDVLSGQTTVTVGDIIVHYNAYAQEDNIKMYYKQMTADNELKGYVEGVNERVSGFNLLEEEGFEIVRISWKDIAKDFDDDSISHLADENIKIEVKDSNLIVTRRLGVIQRVEEDKRITIKTPPGQSIGGKVLTVYNSDGAKATSNFTYTSPYRPPVINRIIPTVDVEAVNIEGILRDISLATGPPAGGSILIIEGRNFRAGVRVYIGDTQAIIRSRGLNDDELIVEVPAAATGAVGPYLQFLVINEDGGQGYGHVVPEGSNRRPYYFQYIVEGSSPIISLLNPEKGPTSGGTRVTIKGNEFKDEDSLGAPRDVAVFIGGMPIPQIDVTYVDYNTIEVIVPSGRVGTQTVEVVNYDYGRAIGRDAFTYISQPRIISVNPAKLFSNDTQTEVTVSGQMFQSGAKVILGGEVIREEDIAAGMEVRGTGIRGVDDEGNNRNVAVVGGIEAASVTVENEETLKVRFPEAFDLKNSHIIILNPDGGVSEPYRDFNHQIPIPTKPLVLEAIPGFESTVQLIWSDSAPEVLNAADKYEIYGKKSTDRNYSFIGDTEGAEFLVRGLEPNTRYDFMVRALNRYGSALEFAEVTVRTLSPSEDDKLKDKQEELDKAEEKLRKEGKEEIIDGTLIKTIGTEQITSGGAPYIIDFSLSQYNNHDKFVVAIPVAMLADLNRNIMITDGNANFSFNARNLYTREVIQGGSQNREDAHVEITFEKVTGQTAEGLYSAIPRNQRRASAIYSIDFNLQVGRNRTAIRQMLQSGNVLINYDSRAYPNTNSNSLFIGKYDPSRHEFTKQRDGNNTSFQEPAKFILLTNR
ncbi:IPT/TIG domain-containing protein [Natronincola peptidivorans]|uniref:IPT/TIG domain-containing protein n=1 Tax=Natronincola peptidivorans TaxID=426128 RepID=A0A1I0CRJ6_9FIRM|nr:IPT/TIG domain-containing protein [Natronincola peptidivorans]SET22300.1 IPT/TIG domain-containing protein [Natronincola peptidivorans]